MRLFALVAFGFALIGCEPLPQEKHVVSHSGIEYGVEIEVLLSNGGRAKLVCPKFNGEPRGSHGRECYLRSYDKNTK